MSIAGGIVPFVLTGVITTGAWFGRIGPSGARGRIARTDPSVAPGQIDRRGLTVRRAVKKGL